MNSSWRIRNGGVIVSTLSMVAIVCGFCATENAFAQGWSLSVTFAMPEPGQFKVPGWFQVASPEEQKRWGTFPYKGKASIPPDSSMDIKISTSGGKQLAQTFRFRRGGVEQKGLVLLLWFENGEAILYPSDKSIGIRGFLPWIPPAEPVTDETPLKDAVKELTGSGEKQVLAALALIQAAQYNKAADKVEKLLRHDNSQIRAHAAKTLGNIGPRIPEGEALKELNALLTQRFSSILRNANEKTKARIIQAVLNMITSGHLVSLLAGESDPAVRDAILWAVFKLSTRPQALKKARLATLEGVTAELRATESGFAAEALLSIDRSKGTEALCNLLKEKSPGLRRTVAEALGRGENVLARRALSDLVTREESGEVRQAASKALRKLEATQDK